MADTATVIPDDASHEQITEAVDQIIADRTADETPGDERASTEETSDAAKIVPGEAFTEDTTEDDEQKSDSETTGKGESAEETSEDDSWREEAEAEAAAYGIGKDEIADFTSREELDRTLKLFDRQLDAERKKVLGEQDGLSGQGEEDKGGKTQKKGEKPPEASETDSESDTPRLDKDTYDDELVKVTEHQESRISKLESALAEMVEHFHSEKAIAAEERFDRSVDELQFSELFGKTGEEGDADMKRRNELFERVEVEQIVMSRIGRDAGDYDAMVLRVARSAFPKEYDRKLIKNHTRKISRQSNGRQGVGATRPTDPPETLREETQRHYDELQRQSG